MADGWLDELQRVYKKVATPERMELILEEALDAKQTGQQYHDITCRECEARQKVRGEVRNWTAIDNILKFFHDRAIGTPPKAPDIRVESEVDQLTVPDLEALSDEELRRITGAAA